MGFASNGATIWAEPLPPICRVGNVSQAALQGDKSKAGSIVRVPAADVETLITDSISKLSADRAASQTDVRDLIDHVTIGRVMIEVQLSDVAEGNDGARTLTLPWTPPSPYRRREIIQGASNATTCARPPDARRRARLPRHREINETTETEAAGQIG
jgi:hypothetical protein